jgi:hypothetical protein
MEDLTSDCNTILRLLAPNVEESTRRNTLSGNLSGLYKPETIRVFEKLGLWDSQSKAWKDEADWKKLKITFEDIHKHGWKPYVESEDEDKDTQFDTSSTLVFSACF